MSGEEGDCLALPLMGIKHQLFFIQSYPALLGTHSRAPMAALSLLEVTDLVSPAPQLTQALQEISGAVLLTGCVSAGLEQVWVSLKGSACALKPDLEFPVCFITLANRWSNPALGSRFSGKDEQDSLCSGYPHIFFKKQNLLWAFPGIWLQA